MIPEDVPVEIDSGIHSNFDCEIWHGGVVVLARLLLEEIASVFHHHHCHYRVRTEIETDCRNDFGCDCVVDHRRVLEENETYFCEEEEVDPLCRRRLRRSCCCSTLTLLLLLLARELNLSLSLLYCTVLLDFLV